MPSAYRFGIFHKDTGEIVYLNTPLEAQVEIVENLKARVRAKGVAMKTAQHVIDDVEAAMLELLRDLKRYVPPPSQ